MIRLLLPLSLFTASLVHAETNYFAPEGKNPAKGTMEAKPKRTFFKLNAIARRGHTSIFAAGTYELGKAVPSFNCAGTAKAPIRIESAPNARPRVRFESGNGIKLGPGSASIEFSGFEIADATGSITSDEARAAEKPKSGGRLTGHGITIDGRKADDEKKPRTHHISMRDLRICGCPGIGKGIIADKFAGVRASLLHQRAHGENDARPQRPGPALPRRKNHQHRGGARHSRCVDRHALRRRTPLHLAGTHPGSGSGADAGQKMESHRPVETVMLAT